MRLDNKNKVRLLLLFISIVLIITYGRAIYRSWLLQKDGKYTITTDFKECGGTKTGIKYCYKFLTEDGNVIEGKSFKPIIDKPLKEKKYYVVYSESKPELNVLLEDKECCPDQDSLLYKQVIKKEWSIDDI